MSFVNIFSGRNTHDSIDDIYNTNIYITEAIINPGNLDLKSVDIKYLSQKFPDIVFQDIPSGYYAKYDPKNDIIYVSLSVNSNVKEIEAMINHEIIHQEQHKMSKGKFLEQSEKIVRKINNFENNMDKNNLDDIKKYYELLSTFTLASPQEKMTYAYQLVKLRELYGFKNPSDVIMFFRKYNNKSHEKFKIDNQMKMYIGMYWLIKDKI